MFYDFDDKYRFVWLHVYIYIYVCMSVIIHPTIDVFVHLFSSFSLLSFYTYIIIIIIHKCIHCIDILYSIHASNYIDACTHRCTHACLHTDIWVRSSGVSWRHAKFWFGTFRNPIDARQSTVMLQQACCHCHLRSDIIDHYTYTYICVCMHVYMI